MINSKRGIVVFMALILGTLYMGACQDNVNTTMEDSVAPYMELQAIEEASNTTITVNQGENKGLDSYFAFDMSNLQSGGIVKEGLTEGWCLEWDKPIRQNNDVHHGIEMFNTFGSTTWKPANYLMNIKDELKAEDPELTFREIQVALWTLIETPSFDLDKALQNGDMPERMMADGQPNFNIDKVKEINSRVRSEVSQFEYNPGSSYILFSNMKDEQNGGIVEPKKCGDTAWAANGDEPGELRYEHRNNWATYVQYDGVEKTVTLFAGQTINIGTVTFSAPSNNEVTITFDLTVDANFDESESENVKIQDYSTAPSGNPDIGLFDHKGDATGKSFSIIVPQNNYYGVHADILSVESCENSENGILQ